MGDSSPLAHSPTLVVPTEPRARGNDDRLEAGVAVGEYVVERFIGAGAMGEVYAGKHPVIGKRVAIKVLRHELAASTEAAERFVREARAVNQIEHENVVDVFAFGRLGDGRLYLVMDLVEGRSLRTHLIDGPLELGSALAILDTIADALDAAHARGVVHRDLKPDNIVLSNATPPKVFVLDFGIAKLISTVTETGSGAAAAAKSGPGTLTGAGTWLGTPAYMAPEQWSVDGAGPASDRYALGVIAFELLAGALPFSASSVPAMMEQHFRADVPALSSRGAVGLPSALDAVVRRALAKDPDKRYASGRDFVTALRDAAGTGALKARGAVTPPSGPRRMWIPAVAGAGVLGAGIVAVVLLGRDRAGDPDTSAAERPAVRNAPPAGTVTIDIVSRPDGAEVTSNDGRVDFTPTHRNARPGEKLELKIRKPGYLPERRTIEVGASNSGVALDLVEVNQFAGVWQLPDGQLRVFKRRDQQVDVFKATTVTGSDQKWFTRYAFALVDQGVGFGGEDLVADPRAPHEPTCVVRMRVDYFYDPATDSLEQRRDKVELELANGTCTEVARRSEPVQLVRADRRVSDTRELEMPVGRPSKNAFEGKGNVDPFASEKQKKPPAKTKTVAKPIGKQSKKAPRKELPLDPKAELLRTRELEQAKKGATEPAKPTATYTSPKTVTSGADQNLSPSSSQIVPPPTAPAPQVSQQPMGQAQPPIQSSAPPVKAAPSKSAQQKK